MYFQRHMMILRATSLTVLALVGGFVIFIVGMLIFSEEYRWNIYEAAKSGDPFAALISPASFLPQKFGSQVPVFFQDLEDTKLPHTTVAEWIIRCNLVAGQSVSAAVDSFKLPSEILIYGYDPNAAEPDGLQLNKYELTLLNLSSSLAENRLDFAERTRNSYGWWQVATIVSVAIGMVTTVLVSLNSSQIWAENGQTEKWIRVLAIFFPALGTAVAAVVGFYGPQAQWAQASRALAGHTQLQSHLSLNLLERDCPEDDEEASWAGVKGVIDDVKSRMNDLQLVSATDVSKSASQSSAAPGAGQPAPPAPESPGPADLTPVGAPGG